VRIVHGAAEGRRTLLHRQPLGETELPEAIRRANAALFGADLPVEQQVRRILADVLREGDAAIARYSKAFAGVDGLPYEVTRADIEAPTGASGGARARCSSRGPDPRAYHERRGLVALVHGRRWRRHAGAPIERVGIACRRARRRVLPSSVLMTRR
jgi:histidinol dehydrogenase